MKLTKNVVDGIQKAAIVEREKAQQSFERQQGVINLCEWLLKNCELEEEVKGDSNGGSGDVPGPEKT